MTAEAILCKVFPRLQPHQLVITSQPTNSYNCIAWAADDHQRWWWPAQTVGGQQLGGHYWPPGIDLDPTIGNFIGAYRTLGYEPCATGALEAGLEKVAIYANAGAPTHAARQLPDGRWTSKCGPAHDITHETVDCIGGTAPMEYGDVVQYMSRPATTSATL